MAKIYFKLELDYRVTIGEAVKLNQDELDEYRWFTGGELREYGATCEPALRPLWDEFLGYYL